MLERDNMHVGMFYAYKHKSRTWMPNLGTRDGGLNIFYGMPTLPTHPMSQTLMYNLTFTVLY